MLRGQAEADRHSQAGRPGLAGNVVLCCVVLTLLQPRAQGSASPPPWPACLRCRPRVAPAQWGRLARQPHCSAQPDLSHN